MSGSSWMATAAGPRRAGCRRVAGHARGARRVTDIVNACPDLGVTHLTLYAFSTENWRRPLAEVDGLMRIFRQYILRKMEDLRAHDVRVRFIGMRHRVPPRLRELMARSRTRTRDCGGLNLSIAIDYGGRDELTRAMRALAREVAAGALAPEAISEATICRGARHPRAARPGPHHPHLGRAPDLELPALAGRSTPSTTFRTPSGRTSRWRSSPRRSRATTSAAAASATWPRPRRWRSPAADAAGQAPANARKTVAASGPPAP